MTQEDKELLLKDLCARLPYGVNVEYTFKVTDIETNAEEIITKPLFIYSINTLDNMTVSGIDDEGDSWICFFEEIKPYLFPMSSMTHEQRKELIAYAGYERREEDAGWHSETYYYDLVGHENCMFPDSSDIDWLNKNHFDYRGLIEKGLAIDATNKNIY